MKLLRAIVSHDNSANGSIRIGEVTEFRSHAHARVFEIDAEIDNRVIGCKLQRITSSHDPVIDSSRMD